jgi:hypothetical protein
VLLGVHLRCVLVVLGGVQVMTMRHFGVMRRLFVVSGLVVLGGFAMVLGRVLVVVRGLVMMFVNVVIVHRSLPGTVSR